VRPIRAHSDMTDIYSSQSITAWVPNRIDAHEEAAATLETGDMVKIDTDALPAGIEDAHSDDDNTDGEFDYTKYGFVVEKHTDNFEFYDAGEDATVTVTASSDSPVYVVGLAPANAGSHPFSADVLTKVNEENILGNARSDTDLADAAEEMRDRHMLPGSDQTVAELEVAPEDVVGITRNDMGLAPWPESWREADKPARLIALDAWTSMGGTFRGCRRSVIGNTRNPNGLCAAFKDSILGYEGWRNGG